MFLDAPIWGTKEHAAKTASLTILAGGDPALWGAAGSCSPISVLSIIHVGGNWRRHQMKFIVNLVQAELIQALSESLVFGEKMGFTADKILEVLDSGGVASPLFHSKGRTMGFAVTSPQPALQVCPRAAGTGA